MLLLLSIEREVKSEKVKIVALKTVSVEITGWLALKLLLFSTTENVRGDEKL